MKRLLPFLCGLLVGAAPALAEPPCGVVEIRFVPGAPNLQMVAWIEDTSGNVVATPYITRVTGQFGLANRPGAALLKTAFGWPYGRREMVMPVWAHRRNHHYPKVVMGGACGNSPSSNCPNGSPCGGDCEDSTIAYHSRVSSTEPFYCAPDALPDAVSCASVFTGSKGAYTTDGSYSLYPPRADLKNYNPSVDSTDIKDYPNQNDLVAVSAATPPAKQPLNPPIDWCPGMLPVGDYVAWVEVSQESDFNGSHNHPNADDTVSSWNFEGHPFLGQPSIVYKVPFHYDGSGQSAITSDYAGYSTWDGSDGTLHPPDGTITTTQDGSGLGRLLVFNDGVDNYRVKVVVGACPNATIPPSGPMCNSGSDGGVTPNCTPPDPVTKLVLTPDQTDINVSFTAASTGAAANRFSIRYANGTTAITDANFDQQLSSPSVAGAPGQAVSSQIAPLDRDTDYTVAVRAVAPCGATSTVVSATTRTQKPKFATLSGCFIATAAYGTPFESQVTELRNFRDKHLLTNPAGQLLTAAYYALSPPFARAIASDEHLRALARRALEPIVTAVTATEHVPSFRAPSRR